MSVRLWIRRLGLTGVAYTICHLTLEVVRVLVRARLCTYAMLGRRNLITMGHAALARGRHDLALEAYLAALALLPEDSPLRLQIGTAVYLGGDNAGAEQWFSGCYEARLLDASRWGLADSPWRVLDPTWLLAIGHIASLDTYSKAVELGWMPRKTALLAYDPSKPPAGWPLFRYLGADIRLVPSATPDDAMDAIVHGADFSKKPRPARDQMRTALSLPFWYGVDPAGRVRWFGPYAAGVEAAWKASGRAPLLVVPPADRSRFRQTMDDVFGLPPDAWFVVLHVREPGYHASWHKHHPASRNADIATYASVIDYVLAQGGWVVRAGDPSMVPLTPRDRVIDYAVSEKRSPELDVLLCAECRYFIGTNSGLSLLPAAFGRRCVLTNWSPLAAPNWYPDDVFIPKLVRRRGEQRHLTFAEMFRSRAAWGQFLRDYDSAGLVIEDNHPDDLQMAVQELHEQVLGAAPPPTAEDDARLQRFEEVVASHDGYVGSRMSYRFLAKYPELLA
jgi:putative glycosyltransferase (TIGR04372 family)